MRARIASLVAAASIALPLAIASAVPALAATRHELLLRIIDPSGHSSCAQAQVINTRTDTSVMMGTGSRRDLPAGTYNVAAWILSSCASTAVNPTYTLADQVVTLNRNRTVTLDARQGKPVRLGLNNPQAFAETLEIAPIVNGQWAFNPTTIAPPVGLTYVVPTHSTLMKLYVYSIWEEKGKGSSQAEPSPFRYDIVNVFRGGIPDGILIRTRTAQLARINVTVRAIDANEQASLMLSPFNGTPLPFNDETYLGGTPAHLVSYRTPGYQWQPILEWDLNNPAQTMMLRDNDLNQGAYGHRTYNELWGAAVFSPATINGVDGELTGRQLSVGMQDFPIADALHPTDEGNGKTQLKLYAGGKLLGKGQTNVNARIPTGSHTYTLTLSATRPAGSLLSTQINGIWKFVARGSNSDLSNPVQIYGLQIVAAGLNRRNDAAGGSLTSVTLRPYSDLDNAIALPVVHAWASSNDGKSWGRVSVRRVGSHYVISVRNARSAGFTSLRIYIADHAGNSEELTVIHAYGIS